MSEFDHFIGTRPVSDKHAFDTAALTAWLEKNLEGFAGPLTVEMFKGGQSNPTYKLVTPGQSYVMRSKPGPVAKLLPSAHAVEREFAVMRGLHGTDVPVPRMYCLCEDESVIGRAFYVMEFMQGRVLWDQSLPGMTPPRARRNLRRDEPRHLRAAQREVRGPGPGRLRQARQLLRSPDRPLEQAVQGLHRRCGPHVTTDPRDGTARRMAARPHPGGGARRKQSLHRPRRLSPGQPDVPCH